MIAPQKTRSRTGGQQGVHVRDVWRMLRRHKTLSVGVPLLVFVATAVFVLLATPVYEASSSIRIDERRSNVAVLDILQNLSSGSEVNTEMEVLRSRTLAETVTDSLALQVTLEHPRKVLRSAVLSFLDVDRMARPGAYRFRRVRTGVFRVEAEYVLEGSGNPLWPFGGTENVDLGEVRVGERASFAGLHFELAPGVDEWEDLEVDVALFQRAVRALRETIQVTRPNREADIVVVGYEGTDPELVRAVPDAVAGQFIAARRAEQKREAVSTVEFLEEQLDTLSGQLLSAENALRVFREERNVVNLEAEASAQVERLADMQAQRDMLEAERVGLARLLAEVEGADREAGEPSPYRRLMFFPSLLRNQAAAELLGILADLDNQRSELLRTRTLQDQDVQTLTTRIEELEEQLHSIATTYLQGITNQVNSLDGTLARFEAELGQIPEKELRLARLRREAEVLGEIYTMLQTRLKEAQIAAAVEDGSVRVVDPAVDPLKPIRPNGPLSMALAAMLGLMLGVGAVVGREYMDTAVHTREEVQQATGLNVLGVIPTMTLETAQANGGRWPWRSRRQQQEARLEPRLMATRDPRSPVSEAYRSLRTNITFSRPDETPKTLVFTSSMPGDGKSTTAMNLAITLAQQGLKLLLVDTDMRRGELNTAFGEPREPGLSELLLGRVEAGEAVRRIDLEQGATLDFLATGTLPPNPAELLGSAKMRSVLEGMEERYDSIILDAPPLNVVTDAAVLGTNADGVLLVVRAGISDRDSIDYAIDQLEHVRAPLLGVVLNDVDYRRQSYYGGHDYAYFQARGRG